MSWLTLELKKKFSNKPTIFELGGKLNPCPFCGGNEVYFEEDDAGDFFIRLICRTCGASGPWRDSKVYAARAWQSRK